MKGLLKFLFPVQPEEKYYSVFLLLLRLILGILFLTHGIPKLVHFESMAATFPDPLGVGSSFSLGLVILAEVICSFALILGVFYRLALIPMIFDMGMAVFVIHAGGKFVDKELALIYMLLFILLYIAGPGRFAVDRFIALLVQNKYPD